MQALCNPLSCIIECVVWQKAEKDFLAEQDVELKPERELPETLLLQEDGEQSNYYYN